MHSILEGRPDFWGVCFLFSTAREPQNASIFLAPKYLDGQNHLCVLIINVKKAFLHLPKLFIQVAKAAVKRFEEQMPRVTRVARRKILYRLQTLLQITVQVNCQIANNFCNFI